MATKILGICGSLRKQSFNLMALKAAQALVPADTSLDVYDIAGLPLFNQDEEKNPTPKVTDFKAKIRAADAILFAVPEYNYSIAGVLKNAIDVASRPYGDSAWTNKPVAMIGASVGILGTARAQYHLRQCFVFLNMYPINMPEVLIRECANKFDASGNLTDETAKGLIKTLLTNLVAHTKKMKAA
jgi:chromate reductase, NAD(P)H dehydrogenase (quinone)